jgi:ubiquinone/menaquinone biosynthesis C-methylase UbiE
MELPLEFLKYRHWRKKIFQKIRGKHVLEVGVGTGKNLKYYGLKRWTVTIDVSEGMLSKAKPLAKTKGISLVQMDAQQLAFKDNVFDTVLATFVFCSVPDPVQGLEEIKRVLKPDGQLLLIEHVLPGNPILRWIFNVLDPFTSSISGVHINRKTSENIRKAGFELKNEEDLFFSIFKFFKAKPYDI